MTIPIPLHSSIPQRLQVFAIIFSFALLFLIIFLVRKGKLKEGYSIIWLAVSLLMIFISFFDITLDQIALIIGISYVPAVLILFMIIGLFLLAIHFSLLFSRYDRRIRLLAQEYAILKSELKLKNTDKEHQSNE